MEEKKRILITGGSGFIGTNLVEFYLGKGWDVLSLDSASPRNEKHKICFRQVDILNRQDLLQVFKDFNPHYLVHLAARTDLDETKDLHGYDSNMQGVSNVLEACNSCHLLERAIFASSMLVCRFGYIPKNDDDYAPNTLYGESKVITEKIIKESPPSCSWLIVRPTSIWGPWFGVPYRSFFECVIKGIFVHPGKRAGTATYGYIGNTVCQIDALLQAEDKKVRGKVFYLGDEPANNLSEWADEIASVASRRLLRIPYGLMRVAALGGDLLGMVGITAPLTSFRLRNMTSDNSIDLSKTVEVTGDPLYSRVEGVRKTIKWLQEESV